MTTLVIGFGNHWRGDDAAGLAVAERLRGRLPGVRVLASESVPPNLFEFWGPDDRVVLIDAARSGAAPGTVHRFDALAAPLPCDLLRLSTHTGGVGEAIELARALSSLPAALVVYGIEGASYEHGAALGPESSRAVDEVAERVAADAAAVPPIAPSRVRDRERPVTPAGHPTGT